MTVISASSTRMPGRYRRAPTPSRRVAPPKRNPGRAATLLAAMSSDHPAERSQDHLALSIAKRAFDVAAAAAALLLTLPITLAVALAILLESGGPVLYRGWRVGRDGQIFRICKFRSMFTGADRAGGVITAAGDTRVTRVGRVLRRT